MNDPTEAFSYIRFSTPEQASGDSLRRQSERAEDYCGRRGWVLNTTLTLRDLGVSAFRGSNAAVGNFRTFLDAIKSGRVRPGSVLVVESFDRISRQGIDEGYDIIKGILKAGVTIVTLSPEREFDASATKSLSRGALEIQLILERAAEESETKSKRVGAAWEQKRKRLRESGAVLTRMLPAWVRLASGKLELVPERAAIVRRVFDLATSGYGHAAIVAKFTADGVKPFGKGAGWGRSYIAAILADRRALGEFQPARRSGEAAGDPVPGYFPAAVDERTYLAARAATDSRRQPGLDAAKGKARGSAPKRVPSERKPSPGKLHTTNLFAGLIRSAMGGGSYNAVQRVDGHRAGRGGRRQWVLLNTASAEGRERCRSFPLAPFELAILSKLREVDPREVLSEGTAPDDRAVLAGELTQVESQLVAIGTELLRGDVVALAAAARSLENRRGELLAEIAAHRARDSTPVADAWDDAATLIDALAAAPDVNHARKRLASILRRIVSRITLLVMPRGRSRLAAVRVDFAGGAAHRDYLIHYRPPHSNGRKIQAAILVAKTAQWGHAQDVDLRDPGDAAFIGTWLTEFI